MKEFKRIKSEKVYEKFDDSFETPSEEENYFDTFSKSDNQYKKFIGNLHLNPLLTESVGKMGISFPGFVENCTGEELISSETHDWFVACDSAWVDALYKAVSDYADMVIKDPQKMRTWTNMPEKDDATFYFMNEIGRDSALGIKFREKFISDSLCQNFFKEILIPALQDNGLEYKDALFAFVVYTLLRGTRDANGSMQNDPHTGQRVTCKDILECSNYSIKDYDNRPLQLNMQFIMADGIKKQYSNNNLEDGVESLQQGRRKSQPNGLSSKVDAGIILNPSGFGFDINSYAANQIEIWDQFYRFCEDKGIGKSIFDAMLNHASGNGYDLNDTITACTLATSHMDDYEDPEEYKDLIDHYDGMNNKGNDRKCDVTRLDYSSWLQSLLLWFFGDFFYASNVNGQGTWLYEWIKNYGEIILPDEVKNKLRNLNADYKK